jgi:hypothetical protein
VKIQRECCNTEGRREYRRLEYTGKGAFRGKARMQRGVENAERRRESRGRQLYKGRGEYREEVGISTEGRNTREGENTERR